jgi:hypothetical protein
MAINSIVNVLGGGGSRGVTRLVAGTNVTLSPASGVGVVTINSSGGGGGGYTSVNAYADLPVTVDTPAVGTIYAVLTSSGIWLINYHPLGLYERTANNGVLADWTYMSAFPDAFSDANFQVYDDADTTKLLKVNLGGGASGKVMTLVCSPTADRSVTFPDATCTLLYSGGPLGTPSSGVGTNLTGTGAGFTAGAATILATARAIYGNNFDGSAALAQIIASTYGGTGNGFTKFSGPTTAERTKTLRDASDTILELGGSYTPTGTWTSLTLVTPVLGTPASGTLTNCTGLPTAGLVANAVTNAKLAQMANATIKGRTTAGTGDPEDMTAAQTAAITQGDGLTTTLTGFRGIPQNSQSTAYTIVAADHGKHIYHPSADTTARTITIDSNANLALPIGFVFTVINDSSAGVITIAITSDTLVLAGAGTTGSRTLAANGVATAIKITSTRWQINGTGLT